MRQKITVARHGDGWSVFFDDQPSSNFEFRVDAEEAALKLYEAERERGAQVEILVEDLNGEVRPLPVG